ncbi:hypothetical protein [Hyphobacterium sp.]|jgi:hypothetical protein|uniref:hypothetical protein n=1 Tax=Hyphobacterium sp. TaxID=2004662 RepID=UPI003BA8A670
MTVVAQDTVLKFGKPLYDEMQIGFDYSQITWTMQRYNPEMSKERADELLDAFLQWISLSPMNTKDRWITMFKTDVEEAFHCFVLNTRLYKEFCARYLNFFFHHDPLIEESGPEIEEAARFTVESLEDTFGPSLNPELRRWRTLFDSGEYEVACAGPGGSC